MIMNAFRFVLDEGCCFWRIGIYRKPGSVAVGVRTLLSIVLYLYHTCDMICTTSGGVSGGDMAHEKLFIIIHS